MGFNTFVDDQKKVPGEATLSFYIFDTIVDKVHDFLPLKDVPVLTSEVFKPRGMTALFDATGKAIIGEGERLAQMEEANRPEKVVCVIITDGAENSSVEITLPKLKEMIEEQIHKYGWGFVFLGANINAEKYGEDMGIGAANAMTHAPTGKGVADSYKAVSSNIRAMRCCAEPADANAALAFTKEQRQEQHSNGV